MISRIGATLIELIIATALFSTLLVLVLEAMLNMRGLASTVEDIDILAEQADRARRAIESDLANSGWYYRKPGANGRKFYPQIHLSNRQTWQLSDISPPPTVIIPEFTLGPPPQMVPRTFIATVSQNRASVLGDALVFARIQPEGQPLTNTPANIGSAIINFAQSPPVQMDKFANARSVQGLLIDATAPNEPKTSVLWETIPANAGLTPEEMYDDRNVRLFCYRVVPDPVTGRGQLIRYYSNPTANRDSDSAWEVDTVIANDVVGMRIYSYEMATWYAGTAAARDFTANDAAGLTNNQIRFFIDFARNLEQLNSATRIDVEQRGTTARTGDKQRASTVKTLQFTIGLRSITNALDQ